MITKTAALFACAAAALPVLSAPAAFARPASHQVVYRVYGLEGVGSADISYGSQSGEVKVGTVALPWRMSFALQGGEAALDAILRLFVGRPDAERGRGGLYVCEISVDGQLREKVERDLQEGSLECFLGDADNDEVEG